MTTYLRTPFLAFWFLSAASLAGLTLLHGWTGGDHTLADLAWEAHREDALDQHLRCARQRSAGKVAVVAELIDGRLTLVEAAARFSELHAASRGRDGLYDYPALSGEEMLCRNVYVWARNELYYRRDRDAGAVLARLRAEYRDRFGREPGPVILSLPR